MSYNNLAELLEEFSSDWRLDFENSLDESQKNAITTIANNRNHIAHGRQTQRTIAQTKNDYVHLKRVVTTLERILDVGH